MGKAKPLPKVTEETHPWVVLGRFGRVHGIQGLIKVNSYTVPPENIGQYRDWHARIDGKWQAIQLIEKKMHHQQMVVKVKHYDQRDTASQLVNIEIAVPKEQLPELEKGEFYWHDLIGLHVIDLHKNKLGRITDIMSTGANDVLIVEAGEKRHLIPYLYGQVVISVDIQEKTMRVNWDLEE